MTKTSNWLENQLCDMKVVLEVPVYIYGVKYGTPEYWKRLERELQREVKDVEDFIRDHRSRDYYNLSIERAYTNVCKFCGHDYGMVEDTDVLVPECCDQAMQECGYMVVSYTSETKTIS